MTTVNSSVSIESLPQLLSVKDLARFLNIPLCDAYALVSSGELRSSRVGKRYRISKDAVEEYLQGTPSKHNSAYVSLRELSEILGVGYTGAYNLVRYGHIRCIRDGCHSWIPRAAVDEYLQKLQSPINNDDISVKDLMERLDIDKERAYKLVWSGEIRSYRVGGRYRIPQAAVDEYLKSAVKE